MIKVHIQPRLVILNGHAKDYEYSCPYCFAAIKWPTSGALSPFHCPKCKEKLMDISKIIAHAEWRVAYNIEGDKAVSCGSSPLV